MCEVKNKGTGGNHIQGNEHRHKERTLEINKHGILEAQHALKHIEVKVTSLAPDPNEEECSCSSPSKKTSMAKQYKVRRSVPVPASTEGMVTTCNWDRNCWKWNRTRKAKGVQDSGMSTPACFVNSDIFTSEGSI